MEMMTLDGDYQPSQLVERYESLIWTERYATPGDFLLTSIDVERMLKLLPRESLVTLRESTVPMVVESHKILKPEGATPKLEIRGRSFESVLERRAAALFGSNPDQDTGSFRVWLEAASSPSNAAYYVIRRMIGDLVDRRPEAIARGLFTFEQTQLPDLVGFQIGLQSPWLDSNDALPMVDLPLPADFVNVEFADALANPDLNQLYQIKFGNLYSVVMEMIHANHHGLKAVRPAEGDLPKIAIEIYNGADLTRPNRRDTVVFDAKFDQFDDATYLLSETGSTNFAYVVSKTNFLYLNKTASADPSGLQRRVQLVDITGEEGVDTPEARRIRGLMELYKNNATALFDGKIAEQVAAGFNRDYFLGDIIRLQGEYGLSELVRVAEFIRSDDSTGSKAYPTFETIPDEGSDTSDD